MKRLFVFFVFLGIAQFSVAQSEVIEFLKAKDDANLMFEGYLKPYAYALGDGLNNGWYNSAETHKLLGFDLSVSASAIMIPSSAKTFDLNDIGMTEFSVSGSNSITPTIAGDDSDGPLLTNNDESIQFKAPAGTGLDIVPVPVAQLTLGVLPNTDLSVRYVPTISVDLEDDKADIDLFGIGIKHNFLKTIPGLRRLPLDASAFIGYSKIDAESTFSYESGDFGSGNTSITFENDGNQKLDVSSKTLKFGLIVSKKLGPITFWGSIMESRSKSTVDLLGKYVLKVTYTEETTGTPYTVTEPLAEDPIDLDFKTSNVSLDAGLRLKLAFFSLFGSVSKAEYTSFNAGISLGFR
jgi:hypothetical protein